MSPERAAAIRIGVKQGRLSPRPADRPQAFPWQTYRREFTQASTLGFRTIEWMFEAPRYRDNPLWSEQGREEIRGLVEETGVQVGSVCADYFMVHRLAGEGPDEIDRNRAILRELIPAAKAVGAKRILVPLLESAAVPTPELQADVLASLRDAVPIAERLGIVLALEMEIPGPEYAAFVARVGSSFVRAYYDTGNSTAQGADIARDVVPLLPLLEAVHIKDRVRGGGSKPLGTGDCDFAAFFRVILGAGFRGDLVLEHFYEGDAEREAERSLSFVRRALANAGAEVG